MIHSRRKDDDLHGQLMTLETLCSPCRFTPARYQHVSDSRWPSDPLIDDVQDL